MNRKQPRNYTKPGAERRGFVPDKILRFEASTGEPLLDFLLRELQPRKKTAIKSLLRYGQVAVGGQPTTQFDTPLYPGTVVEVNLTRPFVVFSHRRIKIVHEDEYILVIDKDYGLLSVGTGKSGEETAYDILKEYLKLKDPANKIFVVHRLDRSTSGLMMFAKTQEAKDAMQRNWNNMVLNRTYIAVVQGRPDPPEGTVRSYLKENQAMAMYSVEEPDPEAQLAVTRYKTLKTAGGYSTVELELDTGRKNQIRVHMKDLGTPIAGDRKYGGRPGPFNRIALHARTLRFIHPATRKEMNFVSNPRF